MQNISSFTRPSRPSMDAPMSGTPCDDEEVSRIAQDLATKYGYDAIPLAKARHERAREIGDELAQEIWAKVIAAVTALKAHQF